MASLFPASFVDPWRDLIGAHEKEQANDFPSYSSTALEPLITTSTPTELFVGTGHTIYERALLPAIRNAKRSVHLVTCFWADSPTANSIRATLFELAASRASQSDLPTLHITIGFSSRGLFQKLFHTSSRDGHVYPPSEWKALKLPDQQTLRSGSIELTVKTLFFSPISVMHPKYLIVDDTVAWVPSCNISWEKWFEGCVELRGGAVNSLLSFHERVWGLGTSQGATAFSDDAQPIDDPAEQPTDSSLTGNTNASRIGSADDLSPTQSVKLALGSTPTILLPSSHHRNPGFSWIPFLRKPNPPMTPLNAALLTLFANAQTSIVLVTPNVTAKPVINAILAALVRGVSVEIRTNESMMLIEQLITCGTTTSRCMNKLMKEYSRLALAHARRAQSDLEAQPHPLGQLQIFYYQHRWEREGEADEPVVSHFKMTMVDDRYLVLGSGNMDRASWWTSQELGILFYVPGFSEKVLWERALRCRGRRAFPPA
ncbi:MmgE/PrpD family protein [Cordyceps fumosorosea ARSEF 2679]|uniref:MmgE/PrpD family protein n=1 Tax=Cordyceps fumosorosea (strain ARSEF 2679) TaxID=1081104 RepID=A0A162M1J2_CORFA|nr:MmgE/PrpD family protein [Cordyceps fumosorosea ARSEF 2679]OAA48800.1 MmgE/PrpD family protein [Cordyceps fumosorosea ARSEF 2679]